jgi:hypothetical protein
MSMMCPRCQRVFEQQLQCDDCGCRLQFQPDDHGRSPETGVPGQWQHTPWGKILVGVLLAVGLSYGLEQLCTAGLRAGEQPAGVDAWRTLGGLVLLQALQAVALLVGGAVTGAGQPRGMLYGGMVGLVSGLAFLGLHRQTGTGQPEAILYAQPVLQAIVGLVGGLLGMVIWKPPPVIPLTTGVTPAPRPSLHASRLFAGPIHVGRVTVGVAIVVAGMVWSNFLLDLLLRNSNGTLAITSHLQARLIGWEIAGLATLLGSGLAGATTFNGLKQGLCVGVGAAIVFIGIQIGQPTPLPESLVLTISSLFVLTLAGGWFGGQLFPPIVATRRRGYSGL